MAIAGNAVENVVGIQIAARNQVDLAISLIMNSSLQVALALTPALVLISLVIGGPALTLVLSPLLLGSLGLAVILGALIVFDGESTWLEGLALIALYLIIAASVWYGPVDRELSRAVASSGATLRGMDRPSPGGLRTAVDEWRAFLGRRLPALPRDRGRPGDRVGARRRRPDDPARS